MTRETKIGLLVGMGFIIMFGIILSEHGARRRAVLAPRDQAITDTGGGAAGTRLARAPRPEVAPIPQPVIVPDPKVVVQPAPEPKRPVQQVADASEPARPTEVATPPVANVLFSRRAVEPASDEPVAVVPAPSTPTVSGHVVVPQAEVKVVDARQAKSATESPTATGVVYVVRKNDNLTKIAKRTMGSDSPKTVQLLFDTNRGTLKSKNSIRVGQTLQIPLPSDQFVRAGRRGDVVAAVNGVQLRAETKPVSSQAATFRWYQVKQNDSWRKIAEQELGSQKRWRELYELNRSKFPDPNRIRPGVRVKVPLTSRQVGQALADAPDATATS